MPYTIWKAILQARDVQDIEIPEDAELLTAGEQRQQICVWFKCDPAKPMSLRKIAIVGTGNPAPEGARYVGTAFMHGGELVFHVFERIADAVSSRGKSHG